MSKTFSVQMSALAAIGLAASVALTSACFAADGPPEAASHAAVQSLEAALTKDLWGEKLAAEKFAHTPLTKADAAKARELLWQHYSDKLAKDREPEVKAGKLVCENHEMPFYLTTFGDAPKTGQSFCRRPRPELASRGHHYCPTRKIGNTQSVRLGLAGARYSVARARPPPLTAGVVGKFSGAGKLVGDVTEPPTASRAGGCVDGDCPGDERV